MPGNHDPRHITNGSGGALCGGLVLSWEWTFRDFHQAREAVAQQTELQPCRACLAIAQVEALGHGQVVRHRITE